MICVINPDGTITCSDGTDATTALNEISANATAGVSHDIQQQFAGPLGQDLKSASDRLRKQNPSLALVVIGASMLTAK